MANRKKLLKTITARILAIRADIGEAWPTGIDLPNGVCSTTDKTDWTGAYWIEMLRIAGERTGDWDLYLDAAARLARLRPLLDRHSFWNAPAFYYSAARLYETLSDRTSRTYALSAAYSVRAMADPARGAVRLDRSTGRNGSQFHVPIEAAHHGVLLDWWALQETGDTTFLDGAERMLDLLIDDFIDGRDKIPNALSYDAQSGALIGEPKRRPKSRLAGSANALCGLLHGWEITREARFLSAATHVLEIWVDQYAAGGDETLPTAMVCEALARLVVLDPQPKEIKPFVDHLDTTLDSLADRFASTTPAQDPIAALCHFYAALHCLDVGGLPC